MMLFFVDVATISKEVIIIALNSDFKDFEDALQNFCAQANKEINIIVTRNIKDYKKSELSVMSPEMY